jgi:ribonuclease HI
MALTKTRALNRLKKAKEEKLLDTPKPGVYGWFDGACVPNPGFGAIGIHIERDGKPILSKGCYIGPKLGPVDCTNNMAEYAALIVLFTQAAKLGVKFNGVYGDSQLVINQVTGTYSANNMMLDILSKLARYYFAQHPGAVLEWIPREKNTMCDALSKEALALKAPKFDQATHEWWHSALRTYKL